MFKVHQSVCTLRNLNVKPLILVLVTIILTATEGFTQRNYRIRKRNNHYYSLPPHTTLGFNKNKKVIRNNFKYFSVVVKGLNGNYAHDLDKIASAETGHNKKDLIKTNAACKCSMRSGGFFKWQFSSNEKTDFILQLNFEKLTKGTIKTNFEDLMIELAHSLAANEQATNCACASHVKFPTGFSQKLLKTLREKIPLPVELPQPGSCFTAVADQSYFMLLDDDLQLRVDNVERLEMKPDSDKFRYQWKGSNIFSFQRSTDGGIIQNSFALFDNGLPTNFFGTSTYNIASFADLQLSNALKDVYYVALFHPVSKRNTNVETTISGIYTPADDSKVMMGNPFLVHLRSSELATLDFHAVFGSSDNYTKSFFNERGSIAPLIKAYINGQEQLLDLSTRPMDIAQLPSKFRFYRKCGKTYRRVKGEKNQVILLPNDHITYKL